MIETYVKLNESELRELIVSRARNLETACLREERIEILADRYLRALEQAVHYLKWATDDARKAEADEHPEVSDECPF